jgi:hypothetical protein
MNWRSGIFRLWLAGALVWTVFWGQRLLCLESQALFDGECGAWTGRFDYGLAALAALFAIWIGRGLGSLRSAETGAKRHAGLRRAA